MSLNKGPIRSNLDSFLKCATPVVQSQVLPKREIRSLNKLWYPWGKEEVEYFTLGDLWNSYDEWSAYGTGVPVSLEDGEPLVQYFVPYLSAIQIFTSNSTATAIREETDVFYAPRDSFSDSVSSGSESSGKPSRSSSEDGVFEKSTPLHPSDKRLGYLYFQYFEMSAPCIRIPLMDKINELAQRFPKLLSLRSVDLSPASWIAVAWNPIYHIPMGRNVKDLSTCFLTYHTISSSFQDTNFEDDTESPTDEKQKQGEGIPLPPFGLATYKMQGTLWVSGKNGKDQEKMESLLSVADSWLKQLKVQHHDFNFFSGFRRG